jgi:hypothetical protein
MNINRLDKIEVTNNKLNELYFWKRENRELFKTIPDVLTEGIICVKDTGDLYFKSEGDNTKLIALQLTDNKNIFNEVIVINFNRIEKKGKIIEICQEMKERFALFEIAGRVPNNSFFKNKNNPLIVKQEEDNFKSVDELKETVLNDSMNLYQTIMVYMASLSTEVIEKTETLPLTKHQQKQLEKRKEYIPSNIVNVNKKIYIIPNEAKTKITKQERRAIQRRVESWNVRGHYRHIKKSDKTVWIKPHIKGHGSPQNKVYKIE